MVSNDNKDSTRATTSEGRGGLMPTENDLALLRQKAMAQADVKEKQYRPKNRKEKRALKSKRYKNKVKAAKERGDIK